MIRINAQLRKPIETSFHKDCQNEVRKQFYYYMPKDTAKGYVNDVHSISVRLIDINEELRGLFCKFLTHIQEEITDQSLYVLSMLQKVGEDKIRESLGYNNSLCSSMKKMTLADLGGNNTVYSSGVAETMFKESLGLSIYVAQALIFAFNAFKSIWGSVKHTPAT
jgi:hypothetical protein